MNLPIADNGLDGSIVHDERNVESNNWLAGLNEVVNIFWDVGSLTSSLQEHLNVFQESWLSILVKFILRIGSEGSDWCLGYNQSILVKENIKNLHMALTGAYFVILLREVNIFFYLKQILYLAQSFTEKSSMSELCRTSMLKPRVHGSLWTWIIVSFHV